MPNRRTCTDKTWDDGVESDLHKLEQRKSKINRLKRSPKAPSQPPPRTVDTSDITQPEFKTPTRPVRTRFGRLICKDSPCNDSELQQDIVWDQSTPSPVRKDAGFIRGRGRRREAYTGKTDVNDLVSRIAPKNYRPADSSDSVLQWIGVSGIPCTPEPSQPTIKTKVTRKDTHDHLKELARQFDFQLTRHEGSLQSRCPAPPHPPPPADQDIEDLDLFGDDNHHTPPPAMAPSPADAVGVLSLDHDMDDFDDKSLDELDELFEGPTVSLENGLSQPLSGTPQNTLRPSVSTTSQHMRNTPETSGKSDMRVSSNAPVVSTKAQHPTGCVTGGGGGGGGGISAGGRGGGFDDDMRMSSKAPVVSTKVQHPTERVTVGGGGGGSVSAGGHGGGGGGGGGGGFDDDWEDDGLLDDSMVMEMTQHPDLFAPPKHCSTQKSVVGQQRVLSATSRPTNNSNQHQQYGANSGSRGFGLSQIQNEVKNGQAQRTGVNTNQIRTSSVGVRLPSSSSSNNNIINRNISQSAQPVSSLPGTSSDLPSRPRSKATSTPTTAAVTKRLTRSQTSSNVTQPCLAPQRPLIVNVPQQKTSQATAWTKQQAKAAGTVEENPVVNPCVGAGEAGIPDDDLDILFALDSDWGDDADDDDDLLCEAFADMEEGVLGPAESVVPKSKQQQQQQTFDNRTSSGMTQARTISTTVATAGHVATTTPYQKPVATFAQPVPPPNDRTVYSTLGNGPVAKSAPSATQRTAAVASGGSNVQFQRNTVRLPSATSFGSSSYHATTANHTGGVGSNTQTGQSSFGSIGQRESVRPPSTVTTTNQFGGMGRDTVGCNQSSLRMGSSTSSSTQYSFKKPTNSSASGFTVTTQAPVSYSANPRCSEAEIERKKQEALERRRLRMLATQNQNGYGRTLHKPWWKL